MSQIKSIHARQILDSRGNPTIEAVIESSSGKKAQAAVPSGASTGTREALELRDNKKDYFVGKSVLTAIDNIKNHISNELIGKDIFDQKAVDQKMLEIDGTENKSKLGANAMLAVSLANARLGALESDQYLFEYLREKINAPFYNSEYILPAPMMNIINGGAHASNNLDFQEFMILPIMKKSFSENLRAGVEIFHYLKKVLTKNNYSTNVGDEGGFAPNLESHEQAVDLILESIEKAGYKPDSDIKICFDVAASEFYEDGFYKLNSGKKLNSQEMIDYLESFTDKYPVYSIEDGLSEHDKSGWTKQTALLGNKVMTVGDDLFVTNKKILAEGIEKKQANSILIKVNQIGTLTETFETISLAQKNNLSSVISHRSGETSDTFISDLAVATSSGFIKTGSASRSDRVEKYNQLIRIEEHLGGKAKYKFN